MSAVPSPADRLELADAVLSRTDLNGLGWPRRAVGAIFKECARREGVVILPGYSRPMVRVETYRAVIAACTYGNVGCGRVDAVAQEA